MKGDDYVDYPKGSLILVDCDGTLTKEICWSEQDCLEATPNKKIINWVNRQYYRECIIIIYTARHESLRQATNYWLKKMQIRFHALRMNKIPSTILLDDKTIRPEEIIEMEKAKKIVSYPSKRWEVL